MQPIVSRIDKPRILFLIFSFIFLICFDFDANFFNLFSYLIRAINLIFFKLFFLSNIFELGVFLFFNAFFKLIDFFKQIKFFKKMIIYFNFHFLNKVFLDFYLFIHLHLLIQIGLIIFFNILK